MNVPRYPQVGCANGSWPQVSALALIAHCAPWSKTEGEVWLWSEGEAKKNLSGPNVCSVIIPPRVDPLLSRCTRGSSVLGFEGQLHVCGRWYERRTD